MAKRYTETGKWTDKWFCLLPAEYKLLWIFVCDTCDASGVWEVNFPLVKSLTATGVSESEAIRLFGDRIEPVSDSKWLVRNFIRHQYKRDVLELNPENGAHLSVLRLLKHHGLIGDRATIGVSRTPMVSPSPSLDPSPSPSPSPSIPFSRSIRVPTEGEGERRNKKNKNLWLEGEVLQGRGIGGAGGGPSMVHRWSMRGAGGGPSRSGGQIALSPAPISPSSIMQLWNALCGDVLPKTQIVNEKREQELKKRIKSLPFQSEWVELFEKVSASSFLNGATGKFKATFDWVIDPANLTKILEGNYDDDKKRR